MARRNKPRWRRWIILAIVVTFFVGLGGTFFWVYERGLKREGLFERAQRALREGHHNEAYRLAQETLVAEPNHRYARELVLEALVAEQRLDEAEETARRYLEEDGEREYAAVRLTQFALRGGRLEEAERLARTLVDRSPGFAYRVLAVIQDHRGLVGGDWRQRLGAASTLRGLITLTDAEDTRAESLLFAASVCLEVLPYVPHRDTLEERARADLEDAVSHVNAARRGNRAYPYDLAMGRIRILSRDEQEQQLGAEMLRPFAKGALRNDFALAALIVYHMGREEWGEAVDLVRELKDTYLWHRVFWVARTTGRLDRALELLEYGPLTEGPDRDMLKAELLLRSTADESKAEGRRLLAALAAGAEDTGVVLRALLLLAVHGDVDTATTVAREAKVMDRRDPRITALLASLLANDASAREAGLQLAAQLAQQTDDALESRDLMRLLGGTQGEAFDRYVEEQVSKGGETGLQHRLHRAMATLARARDKKAGERAPELAARVLADLEALRADPAATKPALAVSFSLAASLGETRLAGALLGRALALPGEPELLDVRVLRLAMSAEDEDLLRGIAAGIREAAGASGAGAFLGVFAHAVETRDDDLESLEKRLEEAAQEAGSFGPALELASRVAYSRGDHAEAERLARAVWAKEPGRRGALEILGSALLRRGAYEETLALYESLEETPQVAYPQLVGAYLQLGRKEEALAAARKAVRVYADSAGAHVLLARLYVDLGEPRKALSVLNMAPPDVFVAHMRAELLRELGDHGMAERLYQVLLASTKFRDSKAWQGLMETLAAQKRTKEFLLLTRRALDSSYLQDQPSVQAMLHYWRGLTLETEGKIEEALADYEASIRLDGTRWMALNNAAWHIAKTAPSRVELAREYVDRALRLQPDTPALLDTAAEVYSRQGDHEGALGRIDEALALKPEGKVRAYTVHKAEILLRADREDEARSLLERLRAEASDDAPAARARDLLWEIERRNLPEEEPVPLPEVPDDEEKPADGQE